MPTLELPDPLDSRLQASINGRDFGWAEQELRKLLERHPLADNRQNIDPQLIRLVQELWATVDRHTPFWGLINSLWSALDPYHRTHFEKARLDFLGTQPGISEA